jgi:cytochrome c peroxidase
MHDGRIKTLYEAVEFMSQYQLGRFMEEKEIRAIEAFLRTLTGKLPKSARSMP